MSQKLTSTIRLAILVALLHWFPTVLLAQQIMWDHDRSVDFSASHTYKWIPKSSLFRGQLPDGSVADDQLDEFIRKAIDGQLQARGLEAMAEGEADLNVNYLGLVGYRMLDEEKVREWRRSEKWIPYEHWKPFHEGSDESFLSRFGTLEIDLVVSRTNKLAWRGAATSVLDSPVQAGEQKQSEDMEARIKDVVTRLLSQYPPKPE